MRKTPSLVAVAALCGTAAALAQVTPVEPFGGRPLGAATAPAPAPVPVAPAAPVVVQPGTSPVVVQAAPPVVVQPSAQAQVQAQPDLAGPMNRPSSVSSSTQSMRPGGGAPQGSTPPQQAQPSQQQQPAAQAQAPAPAPVTPPFQSGASRMGAGAPAAASTATQPPVKGLPADAPRIVLSGSVYSPKASQRMVIANGQVVREGAEIASGVVLEEVRPESAVLGYRGSRYNVFF